MLPAGMTDRDGEVSYTSACLPETREDTFGSGEIGSANCRRSLGGVLVSTGS